MRIGIKHIALLVVALMSQGFGWDMRVLGLKGRVKSFTSYEESKVLFGDTTKSSRKGKRVLTFDSLGNASNWVMYDESNKNIGLSVLFTYKYDKNRNKVEINSDGTLDWKETYKYDKNGNKVEKNKYNSDGSLNNKETYKYDKNGNKVEINSYNSDGSLDWKETYKYGKYGKLLEKNDYDSDGSLIKELTYIYDKKGNKIEYENRVGSSLSRPFKFKSRGYIHDKDGNIIREDVNDYDGGSILYYIYKYDKNGNKSKKITYHRGIPILIEEHEYEYYGNGKHQREGEK